MDIGIQSSNHIRFCRKGLRLNRIACVELWHKSLVQKSEYPLTRKVQTPQACSRDQLVKKTLWLQNQQSYEATFQLLMKTKILKRDNMGAWTSDAYIDG